MSSEHPVIAAFRDAASDRLHGAAEIEEALVRGLLAVRSRWSMSSIRTGAAMLVEGQPAMANLRSLAERAAGLDPPGLGEWLERRMGLLADLPQRLAANAWPLVRTTRLIVTIARSSSVAAVVEGAWVRGWPGSVVVLDGAESGRGWDQARRLATAGEAVSQPDARACAWLDQPGAVAVVGADAVSSSLFVNALGTRNLLTLARTQGVAGLLVADTGKDVSEEAVHDILASSPRHQSGEGRDWAVFEGVPTSLVSARVSELAPIIHETS